MSGLYICEFTYADKQALQRYAEVLTIAQGQIPPAIHQKMTTMLAEAVANALQANERAHNTQVKIVLAIGSFITLSIWDEGGGFDSMPYRHKSMPPPSSLSGRGIPLMEAHCDTLTFTRMPKGMRVSGIWRL